MLKPLCYIYIGVISLVRSLDRTNFVQDILSRTTLEQYLILVRREWIHSNALWTHHRELWAENGDALSRIYAGTGALNTSFTRSGKRTLAGTRHFSLVLLLRSFIPEGVLSDATKSVSRAYINNFQDKGKQVAIDMFLVKIFPCSGNQISETSTFAGKPQQPATSDYLRSDTRLRPGYIGPTVDLPTILAISPPGRLTHDFRSTEYSTSKQCSIFVGTWNLNGRVHYLPVRY